MPSHVTLRQWLRAEPFALGLSSGFFGFYAHCGVVCALEDAGLRPARLCGSSAGALVAGLWGAGLPARAIRDELLGLRRQDFWDPAPGLGLLAGERFARRLAALLPVDRFEDCPTQVAVSVFDVLSWSTRVIDRGPLAPGVQASCTIPVLFQPRRINGRPTLDGGLADRPGVAALGPDQRLLYHHLASRSPWRTKRAVAVPQRNNTATLVIAGLPRLGPFRLRRGAEAIAVAEQATGRALEMPVGEGVVRA